MRHVRLLEIVVIIGLAGGAGGCTNPVKAWQSSLERYVAEHGHGDPNVLRRTDRPPSESDFGLIAARRSGFPFISPRRTDANGVLLGLREIDGNGWYVYLVGMVQYRGKWVDWPLDDPRITDIRLIALTTHGDTFTWLTGDPDDAALEQYCRPQEERWQRSDPSRADSPNAPALFPTDADVFTLTVDPDEMTVHDEHSNAQWTLDLTESDPSS